MGWWNPNRFLMNWKLKENWYLVIQSDLFGMVKWPFQRLSDLQLGDQKVTLNHLVVLLFICCVITLQVTVSHVRRFSGWWCKTPAFSQWVYSIDFVYIASSLETENHLFQCRFLEIYTACIHIAYLVCKDCSHNISSRRNEMVNRWACSKLGSTFESAKLVTLPVVIKLPIWGVKHCKRLVILRVFQ